MIPGAMLHLRHSFRLNQQQVMKLADVCSDRSQVFAASVVLPSIGVGGAVNLFAALVGIALTLTFIVLGVYLLRSPSLI
jgi:flagellar biosynthesis protein FliQ